MARIFSRYLRSERGNIALLSALAMPVLIGAAGLGVEAAYWRHSDLELQQAADKAVYAAAMEKRAGSNKAKIKTEATSVATENGYTPGTLTVNDPPTSGAYKSDKSAIEVKLSREVPRFFSAIFSNKPVIDNVRAVAVMQASGSACVLALSTSAPRAIYVSGSGILNLKGCNVMSNSTTSDSVYVGGSGKLTADCLFAVGDISLNKPDGATTTCKKNLTQLSPAADPYADLAMPDASSATNRTVPNANSCKNAPCTLQPGNYKNGMSLSNKMNLAPGTYIVSGGSFDIGSLAQINGTGVTIYLAPGVSVSMNANAKVNLQAPTSGTYAGMLFIGDRNSTAGVKINGDASASLLTGAIYFPNQSVEYLGNFSGKSGCTRVVAKTIDWSGNATVNQDCTSYGMKDVTAVQVVKIVE